jgi:hypothetical protein
MTEADWLKDGDPMAKLNHVADRATPRKMRLLVCAACRRLWDLMTDPRARQAVETTEWFADRPSTSKTRKELTAARGAAHLAAVAAREGMSQAADYDRAHLEAHVLNLASLAAQSDVSVRGWSPFRVSLYLNDVDYVLRMRPGSFPIGKNCPLIRDVFGNPFRPVALDPAWIAWDAGTVRKMAQAIYDDRAFDRLPVLADALEDAGCNDADVLRYCREPGEHARGCWVIDLLLGKE